jgi:hypothetical protein
MDPHQSPSVDPGSNPSICFICQETTDEDTKLKTFNETTWATAQNAAKIRKDLASDKYGNATQRILTAQNTTDSPLGYHSSCQKRFTAVKRRKSDELSPGVSAEKKTKLDTRQTSSMPKSDGRGLLKSECMFCGKARRKRRGVEEPLLKVATTFGTESLRKRAQHTKNERIRSLLRTEVDLVAKEAVYHKSCRAEFDTETNCDATPKPATESRNYFHKVASEATYSYIKEDVLQNRRSVLVSGLMELYKSEYICSGGDEADIQSYTSQNLLRKVKDKFGEGIRVILADQRKGNFICIQQ